MTGDILIITGASRGIGAACARLAGERGATVAVNYTANRSAAESVVSDIEKAGGKALAIKGDVAVEADVLHLFETVDRQLGRLTGLINNAGIVAPTSRLDDMTAARITRMMQVNVVGSLLCAREAVKRMSTRHGGNGGTIVNLSSAAARLGSPGEFIDYAASKGAIDTFTLGLAREVAREGIRVNAVRPGLIDTEIHAAAGAPDRVARLADNVPAGRGGSAEEVARAILWLMSEDASYVNGALLDVSGGR